jgi:hypothetical protein
MRRFATAIAVAIGTAAAVLYWLHDGDLQEAIDPVLEEWDAETLARDAGFEQEASSPGTTTLPAVDAPAVDAPADVAPATDPLP